MCGVILALSMVGPVYAWAPEGREIIAIVEEQRLEPATKKAVDASGTAHSRGEETR
jgi:hypothetical protein